MNGPSDSLPTRIDSGKLSAWYDFQAPMYHFWRDTYDHPLVKRVAGLIDTGEPQRVLDAGCGSGLMALGLSMLHPDWNVDGIDRSAGLLRIADKEARKRSLQNLHCHLGDVERLPFADGEFAATVAAGLFPNLNEPTYALTEIHRVLRSPGRFVVVEFDRSAMTAGTRRFFGVMIGGYRLFSSLFPRFRFADKWDIDASTIDETVFSQSVRAAGFAIDEVLRENQHLIFVCRKP